MPRHVSPTSQDRTATAPYNFVPLPNRVFTVEDGIDVDGVKVKPWEQHNRFVPGTHSGWLDLEIKTLTPLFIHGAVTRGDEVGWGTRDARLRPEPYTTPEGHPAIPGSSLRGMVRTLVEILSFAKIQPVSRERPFFRTVAPDRLGRAYGERMRSGAGPQGGFLKKQGADWVIAPCEVLRVDRSKLPNQLHQGNVPRWDHQQKACWVQQSDGRVTSIKFVEERDAGWFLGTLVLTGNVPGKKREFVFLQRDPQHSVAVPEAIWERFHDEDQITQWQEQAFPRNQPPSGGRRSDGHLRDGEPVFFLVDESKQSGDNPDGLVFLGRAGMFRFPYDKGPSDLIPEALRDAGLDLAEAMFGSVGGDSAIKGRIYFEDAAATSGGPDWLDEVMVPGILSAPKVTTFQHYLTQDGTQGRGKLTTYLDGDRTTIRGHKLYWHRWDEATGLASVKEPDNHDGKRDELLQGDASQHKQHTIIRPVKSGVTFTGRVRFENLTDIELGALLEAVSLPEGCAHKLGMGKPLGLGSVRIEARLHLIDRAQRYASWGATGDKGESGDRFKESFRAAIGNHASATSETMIQANAGLRRIARIDVLYRILAWQDRPASDRTAYMRLQQFKERPVLPTPHGVLGNQEPAWPKDASAPPSNTGSAGRGPSRASGRSSGGSERTGRVDPPRPLPTPASAKPKPVEKGQTLPGKLVRSGDQWGAVFESDERQAGVINPGKVPPGTPDGARAEFYITEQSKKAGITCRFERILS
ncbi:MAG TPA: TIGR03986 family CRISPR-associated RAMP protein [Thermoanaerobaculia bacterium]